MYINNKYRPNVSVDLDNGVYIFDSKSGTGKTHLCKHLKKLRAYGEPVTSFTYNDILSGESISSIAGDYKVIMLDRYDQYKSIGHDIINKLKDGSIILIDCKAGFIQDVDSEDCVIDITEDDIEVSL